MIGLPLERIRAIRDQHSIVEVLQRYGYEPPARWNGSSDYTICCPEPNHDDRTPSCIVHPQTDRFYCFGCGARGDVLQLVQDVEGLRTLTDVARALGAETTWSAGSLTRTRTDASPPARTSADRILEVNMLAWAALTTPAATAQAHAYLRRRGIDVEMLEVHCEQPLVGYTPAARDGLVARLRNAGVTEDEIIDAGWARATDRGVVDRFHRRVVFPLTRPDGALVGVTGRDVSGVASRRYINTHTTAAFRKRDALFVVGAPSRDCLVTLCEGPTDALAVAASSVRPTVAVAVVGTSLTEEHAARLASWVPREVVVLPDGDAAGREAGRRWHQTLSMAGLSTRFLALPDGVDPATSLTERRPDWRRRSRVRDSGDLTL